MQEGSLEDVLDAALALFRYVQVGSVGGLFLLGLKELYCTQGFALVGVGRVWVGKCSARCSSGAVRCMHMCLEVEGCTWALG